MIKKCEKKGVFEKDELSLRFQYYSVIEVGGAYAHHFFSFMDFLEIPTLILTDIDFVDKNQNKALRNNAYNTSNATIKQWCHDVLGIALSKKIELAQILSLTEEQKTTGLRHLEFQMEEKGAYPRSLEESIMNVNREYYNIDEKEENIDFSILEEKKTDFALDLILGQISDTYQIPSYIEHGLVWLSKQSKMPKQIQPKRMFKRKYKKKDDVQ